MTTNSNPLDAVKTREKAEKILKENGATIAIEESGFCECGETTALTGYTNHSKTIGFVLVCESCGDDDHLNSDIFNK